MSSFIINIRFFYWHLQVDRPFKNIIIKRNRSIKSLDGIPRIEVFKFFSFDQ